MLCGNIFEIREEVSKNISGIREEVGKNISGIREEVSKNISDFREKIGIKIVKMCYNEFVDIEDVHGGRNHDF